MIEDKIGVILGWIAWIICGSGLMCLFMEAIRRGREADREEINRRLATEKIRRDRRWEAL